MSPMSAKEKHVSRMIVIDCEQYFRRQLLDATTIPDRALAEQGLRGAVALRKALEQVPVAQSVS